MWCKHCHSQYRQAWRRGLCRRCHEVPEIKERYPKLKTNRKGLAGDNEPRLPAARPTFARPGSPEKQAVLAERAATGQELWHPNDAREDLQ